MSKWKPKRNEEYFVCSHCGVGKQIWRGGVVHLENYAIGNCFKTPEEANTHSKEILARLEKIYDEGKPLMEVT